MLQRSPALASLGAVAVRLRERRNGSGYPRGLTAASIPRPARLPAAVDVYQAMLDLDHTGRPWHPTRRPRSSAARSVPDS